MKEKVKIVVVLVVILFIFLGIFFMGKKVSLNNYLNKTNKYSNKINYTTGITLNIESLDKQSKIEYTIARTKDIKNIIISKYDDEELTSSINKYLVKENGKTKCYTKDSSSNKVSCDAKEDFKIDYKKLKKNIIKIKKVDNEVINKVSYKKYTVSMKKSDAYNLIYDKDVMDEKNLSGTLDVQILVDKSTNFIYEIDYVIDNLNSDSNNKIKYSVQINNFDFNNNNEINLPF
ncbi:MAG: hypothetical protein J6B64_05285 [Bacilli bacterium]|jgi:hypothetical protein|nr:hypothetical protein [Bacilli bacterium]